MANQLANPFGILNESPAPAPTPAQLEKKQKESSTQKSKSDPTKVDVKLVDRSGRYSIGAPHRPEIRHDNGHLEQRLKDGRIVKVPLREPTVEDRLRKSKWMTGALLTEQQCSWMEESTAAYKHFLQGEGKARSFSYLKYIQQDIEGWKGVLDINLDLIKHVEAIGENREEFQVTSYKYDMGGQANSKYQDEFGYRGPMTENWLKTIGSHFVWISADVKIAFDPKINNDRYQAKVTLHAEDRYNFNRGSTALDVHTQIPDSENGTFELTGLGHQYDQFAILNYELAWIERLPTSVASSLKASPLEYDKNCWVTKAAGRGFRDPKQGIKYAANRGK